MAVLKHIDSKNKNYNQAVRYLLFKYDENCDAPILDENGNMQMRDTFIIQGINCTPMMFSAECSLTNRKYKKNQEFDEIKSHHYIISFDPRDQIDRGLTEEKALELGMEFARKYFPGHETLVCVHTDGKNKSKNIHVHIIINSVRKYEAPKQEWMKTKSEYLAGGKHNCSKKFLREAKNGLMQICIREKLHQVDLLNPSKKRVSDREYHAQKNGQKKLDEANAKLIADGKPVTQTKYQTQKEFLRDAIDHASHNAYSLDQFKSILATYGIETFERAKGKNISYRHPARNQNTSARALGKDYALDHITEVIKNNIKRSQREAEQQVEKINSAVEKQIQDIQEASQQEIAKEYSIFDTSDAPDLPSEEPASNQPSNQPLPDIFDTSEPSVFDTSPQSERQVNIGQNRQPVQTPKQQQPSRKELLDANYNEIQSVQKQLANINDNMSNKENTLNCLDQCNENRATYKEFISLKSNREKGKFRTNHQNAIAAYENARNWLNATYGKGKGKWPKRRQVQQEIDQLTESKSAAEAKLSSLQKERQELIGSRPTPTKVKDRITRKQQGQNRNTDRGDNHARDKPSH